MKTSYNGEELVMRLLELEGIEEDLNNIKEFLNEIISYDDLPRSDAIVSVDDIIAKAKKYMDPGYNTVEEW